MYAYILYVCIGGIDMDLIHQQLVQTEEELSRQPLKIKLNAKPMIHHQAASVRAQTAQEDLEQLYMVLNDQLPVRTSKTMSSML